jgi:uncharacterized protein
VAAEGVSAEPAYEPGAFCWVALATADTECAKRFYSELLGWQPEDLNAGAAGEFTMLRRRGEEVAILYRQTPEARAARVAPHWSPFILVEGVDATAARANGLGGEVLREPFQALGEGRVAPIRDPMGATVSLWQPRGRAGPTLVNDAGALGWLELATADVDRVRRFYGELLGWEYRSDASGHTVITNQGRRNGGMRGRTANECGAPSSWLAYFVVDDAADAARMAESLGGRRLAEADGVPGGRSVRLADPHGATLAVTDGRPALHGADGPALGTRERENPPASRLE